MACNICGSTLHEGMTAGCPEHGLSNLPVRTRPTSYPWICPACGKGNGPAALTCGHCATREPMDTTGIFGTGFTGNVSTMKAGDMLPIDGD